MVRVGGPGRRMLDFFLLRGGLWDCCDCCWFWFWFWCWLWCCCWCWLPGRPDVLRLSRDFLCASVLDLRSVARMEAVTSAEGGSPKMKNLMKAAIRRTTEIWPRMKPCVNENLPACLAAGFLAGENRGHWRNSRRLRPGRAHVLRHDQSGREGRVCTSWPLTWLPC